MLTGNGFGQKKESRHDEPIAGYTKKRKKVA